MPLKHFFDKLYLSLFFLVLNNLAIAYSVPHPIEMFPWMPRATLELASGQNTYGNADVMVPLLGGENESFYVDLTGKYGDDRARLGSVGLGMRFLCNNTIFGGYFFSDYNRTEDAEHFKVLNPGLEFITPLIDGHLNGYFPRGTRRVYQKIFSGTELGLSNSVFYSGHSQFEKLFNLIEEVGSGADFQFGYTIPILNWTRIFAGGYHFSPKFTPVVNGVAAGFETPLKFNWFELKVQDSYDNLEHNTFLVSLQFTLSGLNKCGSCDVHNRMLDLIPRHISNLGTGDGIPSQKKIINRGRTRIIDTNIWFFYPDGASFGDLNPNTTMESCTFEHPCIGLSQDRIDGINNLSPNAKLYLSTGTYDNPNLGSAFSLRNGQSIFGRIPNFSEPAIGSMRPLLNDSLFLEGNNQVYNIVAHGQSLRPLSTGGDEFLFKVGVLLRSFAVGDANIYNSDFYVDSNVYNVVAAANNSNKYLLNINNSNLTSTSTNITEGITIGAANLRTGFLNLNNSSIVTQSFNSDKHFSVTIGFVNNESGLVNINNSAISVTANNGGISAGVLNNSTLGLGLGVVTIRQSNIYNISNNNDIVVGVLNQANNLVGKSAPLYIAQSSIYVTGNNNLNGNIAGILADGDGPVSISDTIIRANANAGTVIGILNPSPATIVSFLNTLIAVNTGGTANGMPIFQTGIFNDLGGNQCKLDGVVVPCLL